MSFKPAPRSDAPVVDHDVPPMMDADFAVETPLQDILPGVEYPAPGEAPPQFLPSEDES